MRPPAVMINQDVVDSAGTPAKLDIPHRRAFLCQLAGRRLFAAHHQCAGPPSEHLQECGGTSRSGLGKRLWSAPSHLYTPSHTAAVNRSILV
jgi:hypothetical protein